MNYNENAPDTGSEQRPAPTAQVYDRKYGYIEPSRLECKLLTRRVSCMGFAASLSFFGMLLISVCFSIVLVIAGVSEYVGTYGYTEVLYYALDWIASLLPLGLCFYITSKIIKMPLNVAVRTNHVKLSDAIPLALAGVSICLLANFPAQWLESLFNGFGIDLGSSDIYVPNTLPGIVLFFITTALIPPLVEEFSFRGVMLGGMRKFGDFFAIMASALIFGMMHMSISSFPFAFLAGFVMGYVYVITGNIWVNVAIHFLNNAISVVLSLSAEMLPDSTAVMVDLVVFYGFIIIGLICLVVLAVRKRLPISLYKPSLHISGGDKVRCFILNPGFLTLLFIFTIYVTLNILSANSILL